MKNKKHILYCISLVLLLLWIPTALEKIMHFAEFRSAILRQPLNRYLAWMAIYSLPPLEIITASMLVSSTYRRWGFISSCLLLMVFTVYIGLALIGTWDKLPCGCGSIITGMSWKQHFWFNLFFLALSAVGWQLEGRIGEVNSKE